LILFYLSLAIACVTCFWTGLIPSWGKWYSIGVPYRQQTDALLQGRLALSESPTDGKVDLAWGRNGVQQVWGLGVPLWRLPFEAAARWFGQPSFPDRIALLIALTLFNFVLLRNLCFSGPSPAGLSWLRDSPLNLMAVLGILLFPPMLSFFKGEFLVYEEAVVYGYLFTVGLFVGLVALVRRPVPGRYYLLCVLAGAAGFFRPTILGYGLVTLFLAFLYSRLLRWPWRTSVVGLLGFAIGNILLLATNEVRFGSPLEFGYSVQLNVFYELKFDAPFQREPLWPAAKELFGSLFFTTDLNIFDWYKSGLVRWQSSTPRWRQFYHTTFDASYLAALILCWSMMVVQFFRRSRSLRTLFSSVHWIAGLWSLLGMLPLAAFYLRSAVMSSRYILDFAPAIAVAGAGLIWSVGRWLPVSKNRGVQYLIALALCGWWSWELNHARRSIGASKVLSQEELQQFMQDRQPFRPLPTFYQAEEKPDKFGIPLNRRGWKGEHGETGAMVVLFVDNPGTISLEVAADPNAEVSDEDYQRIRAKLGLEELTLDSIRDGEAGSKVLQFSAPHHQSYRRSNTPLVNPDTLGSGLTKGVSGIQVLFLGFGSPENFSEPKSNFRLRSVHWSASDRSLSKNEMSSP
jgi:hypothetical protein